MTTDAQHAAAQNLYAAGYRRGREDAGSRIAELEAENTELRRKYLAFVDAAIPFLSESVKARTAEIRAALEAQQ
jgi:hypothetical protein